MCGIIGGPGLVDAAAVQALAHRGPDASGTWQGSHFWLGHTRLSILDVGPRSNQPFVRGDLVLVYNGELWNYRALRAELTAAGARFTTTGDTEVVAAALERWGESALPRFEGMFALAWTTDGGASVTLARDRFGEVPLHLDPGRQRFASEMKALPRGGAGWVEPGHLVRLTATRAPVAERWYHPRSRYSSGPPAVAMRQAVAAGVREREVSDVGFCVLLSGGLDSTVIAHHLHEGGARRLAAYTAVGEGKSADERAARVVAERYGFDLHTVPVPAPSAADLREVVRLIEMPHKAQVEIGWACLHLARAMRAHGHRVTFSGEGSDELWASYGMSYHGIKTEGWFAHRRRLFHDQHRKNFARCNKIFMAAGVECRLPFLSTPLVELALSLPEAMVRTKARPKLILESGHRDLPELVLRRQKMTFQDGAGLQAACAAAVADPARYYRAEFTAAYPGAKP